MYNGMEVPGYTNSSGMSTAAVSGGAEADITTMKGSSTKVATSGRAGADSESKLRSGFGNGFEY